MTDITIRRAAPTDKPEWLRMRLALWPDSSAEEFAPELDNILADQLTPVFVAARANGKLGGFLEGGTRKYADGCETSPVGYLEGLYVDEDLRGQGIAILLMNAAEDWARSLGCQEMASDTWLENEASIQLHLKRGYEEVERLVHFVKRL